MYAVLDLAMKDFVWGRNFHFVTSVAIFVWPVFGVESPIGLTHLPIFYMGLDRSLKIYCNTENIPLFPLINSEGVKGNPWHLKIVSRSHETTSYSTRVFDLTYFSRSQRSNSINWPLFVPGAYLGGMMVI
jgi:hypothetical protein